MLEWFLGLPALQRHRQMAEIFVAPDSSEATLGQLQATGHPPVGLVGVVPPATHPAQVAAQVLEHVLDAVGRQVSTPV